MAATTGPKKVRRYTVEFKIQAMRLSLHPEIQTQDVAQDNQVTMETVLQCPAASHP